MTIEKGFVSKVEYIKHLDGDWRTVHNLWRHIRNYMTTYPAPTATTYSKTEVDAFFEGYSGGKAQVDAGNVVGLTQGSIPFADASGFLTEDNSNLFFDDTKNTLGIGTTSFGASMILGIQIKTGTAPTGNVTDTFAFYSADFAAGNACPYFRTENGTVIGLNQSLLTTDNPTFATGVVIGNLTLANGSITDSGGAISFGNENLVTTGTLGCGVLTSGNIIIPDAGNIGSVSDPNAIAIAAGGEVTLSQTLILTDVVNAGVDTDKFIVLDAGNNIDYRTGAEVLADIGGGGGGDVTAAANIDANAVVIGDDGAKGVKKSTLLVSDAGEMTNPSQPAFFAYNSVTDANETGDGTIFTLDCNTELYDQGGNYANPTFTAPITGKYFVTYGIEISSILAANANFYVRISTSNRDYRPAYGDSYRMAEGTGGNMAISGTMVVDMDINDTCTVAVAVQDGLKVCDIIGHVNDPKTYFSMTLLV